MAGLLTDAEDFRNRERRAIQRKAMAGRDARLTEDEKQALERRMPLFREQGLATERAIANLTPVPAIAEAVADPSLATITNAGVQTAAMAGAPKAAMGLLTAGYGAAAAKDAGMFDTGANAQTVRQSRAAADAARAQGAAAEAAARAEAARLTAQGRASKEASEQAEYDAAVGKAALIRDAELKARRPKPFSETAVGHMYDKTGIATPFLLSAGLAGLTRAGSGGGSKLKDYAIPVAEGAITGTTVANWPLGHELLTQPAENPEKAAYSAYARELPPTHPRKAEWSTYADKLPAANPARETAAKEFYDPVKFAERSGIGLLEGIAGGLAGPAAWRVGSRLGPKAVQGVGDAVEGVSTLPGRSAAGYAKGMTAAEYESAKLAAVRAQASRIPPPEARMPLQPPPAPPEIIPPAPSPMPLAPPRQAQTFSIDPTPSPAAPKTRNRFDPSVYGVGAVGAGAGAAAMSDRAEADPAVLAELVRRGKLPPEVLRPYLGLLSQ